MKDNNWPPQFDGIKIDNQMVLGRVKDTQIWIELDLADPFWIKHIQSCPQLAALLPWRDIFSQD